MIAAAGSASVIASGAAITGYGFSTWAITPPQQHRLLTDGRDQQVLVSLNSSALYAGVALGSFIGGLTLTLSRSTAAVCWTAAGIELAALILASQAAHNNVSSRQASLSPITLLLRVRQHRPSRTPSPTAR